MLHAVVSCVIFFVEKITSDILLFEEFFYKSSFRKIELKATIMLCAYSALCLWLLLVFGFVVVFFMMNSVMEDVHDSRFGYRGNGIIHH